MPIQQLKPGRAGLSRLVLAFGLAALVLKLYLAATTEGTNDVAAFWRFLRSYRGVGAARLYELVPAFNHPPFVLHLLQGLGWLAETTGLSRPFCLRLPAILADFGSLLLLFRIQGGAPRAAICLVAVAPVSILVSGFHGNTDPVMIFFTLLSVLWIGRPDRTWLAGVAMGMSLNIKVVPLMFWPAIFLWLPGWRRRAEYFGAAVLVVLAGSSPVIFQAPGIVAERVLGYPSSYGQWGLSRLVAEVPAFATLSPLLERYGRWCLAAGLVALSIWMNRGMRKPSLYRQLGVVAFTFLAFTPGFGVQYLTWLVPWVVGPPLAAICAFHAASGAFLFLAYTFWCQDLFASPRITNCFDPEFWDRGLPWGLARAGPWNGSLVPFEIACWLSVVAVFFFQVRATRAERK